MASQNLHVTRMAIDMISLEMTGLIPLNVKLENLSNINTHSLQQHMICLPV